MGEQRHERQLARYRRLLVVYPRLYGSEFGPAMVQLFSDRLRSEVPSPRGLGLLRF